MTPDRRVLVTGGTGFIGAHLVPFLTAQGWDTHVLARATSSSDQLSQLGECATIHVIDDRLGALTRLVDDVDPSICTHLATYFVAVHTASDVDRLVGANIRFATHLAEAVSRRPDRHFVNVGTIWQHEGRRQYGPASLYAATKQAFQDILVFYAESRGLSVANLKLADTYGPRDPREKIVNLLLDAARAQKPIGLTEGKQLVDLLYVDDAVSALQIAMASRSPGFASYAISSGRLRTLREVVDVIEAESGVRVPAIWGANEYRPREMFSPWHVDPALPGWVPSVSLEEGIRRMWGAGRGRE